MSEESSEDEILMMRESHDLRDSSRQDSKLMRTLKTTVQSGRKSLVPTSSMVDMDDLHGYPRSTLRPSQIRYGCFATCVLKNYVEHAEGIPAQTSNQSSHGSPDQAARLCTPITNWQFRILALLPGADSENLRGTLHITVPDVDSGMILLEDKGRVQYDALSYCWGEPRFEQSLECNGILLHITASLYAALCCLRDPRFVRHLWIDAICVDQSNLAERSIQVSKMLSIYRKAERVSVWLGPESKLTGVIRLCTSAALSSPKAKSHLQSTHNHRGDVLMPIDFSAILCYGHKDVFILGLHDLLTRQWYKRLWVKQEVWAASDTMFICGTHRFSWFILKALAWNFKDDLLATDPYYREPFQDLQIGSKDTLLKMLARTSSSECTNPRDRVYAVSGMTRDVKYGTLDMRTDRNEAFIAFNYDQSIRQTYIDVVRYYIEPDQCLHILEDVYRATDWTKNGHIFGGKVGEESLPSWCPNWSLPWNYSTGHQHHYCLGSHSVNKIQHPLDPESDVLWLRGVRVASVVIDPDQFVRQDKAGTDSRGNNLGLRYPQSMEDNYPEFCSNTAFYFYENLATLRPQINDILLVASGFANPVVLRPKVDGTFQFVGLQLLRVQHHSFHPIFEHGSEVGSVKVFEVV